MAASLPKIYLALKAFFGIGSSLGPGFNAGTQSQLERAT